MGADALASIRPALREFADSLETGNGGSADELCLTFSIPGHADSQWVQVLGGTLNIAWPRTARPDEAVLAPLGLTAGALTLDAWEPQQYATFTFDDIPLDALARAIDRIFTGLYSGTAPDYDVDVEFSRV